MLRIAGQSAEYAAKSAVAQHACAVAVVGYVVAAWASDLDVANGILPGYVMGLFFFTGYPLRLQATLPFACLYPWKLEQCPPGQHNMLPFALHERMHAAMRRTCPSGLAGSTTSTSCTTPGPASC